MEPAILIVNGDPSVRRWIEATVTSAGLQARSFDSAAALLSQVASDNAACAILDVSLPDANGFDLQDELARAGVTVLFLTRERCLTSCVRAIKAGAVDFISLPCDAGELVRALHYAVRQALWSRAQREQSSELRSRYEQLTPREREVFLLVSSGMLNKQIAEQLDISEVTVQIHRGRVMRKMSTRSFAALVRMADALRLLPQSCVTAWDDQRGPIELAG
ncbi:DNA-binding response regulator [Steroidobacter agaridevorans]|uniref:DNA-binding response regulator n=2 Tax=Steroidobacter agaridevorans TaxID=2695856 RepID=A0A829YJ79_9GAMM|nr:DNA-binding response regulator [Steroidobacter agaridevorans]